MIARKSVLGMWVFLATEVLFFGGLFLALAVNYYLHTKAFISGAQAMNLFLGTINTGLLLTSSWAIAMALHCINHEQKLRAQLWLTLTAFLGLIFLVIKSLEYIEHWKENLVPALNWHPSLALPVATQLFFFLYFVMTLLHGLHLTIGIGLIGLFTWRYSLPGAGSRFNESFENIGLYWHFVDIVWIFLFPVLYLIGRA